MKKSTSFALIVLVQALLLTVGAFAATTVSPPHYDEAAGLVCSTCHTSHLTLGSTGYNNVCLTCHRPGDPAAGSKPITLADAADPFDGHSTDGISKTYQTSHRWDGSTTNPQAGARPPVQAQMTTSGLLSRTGGQLACVSCHNQHSNANGKFLRMANDRDQMCLDCHSSRNTTDHTKGTHPVGVVYDGSKTGFKPIAANSANPSADLNNYLKNGTVSCSTCHGVHFTDSRSSTVDGSSKFANLSSGDGYILRVSPYGKSASDLNICTNCHNGKMNHNLSLRSGKPAVQCNHCHSGHVEYDPAATGSETTPNVYLVRRYLTYTTAGRISKRIIYNSTTTKNFYSASGGGVCQSCHNPPFDHLSGGAVEPGHLDCAMCHNHNDPAGSFSVGAGGCTSCHGQPPSTSGSGGPTGKAAGYTTFNESLTPHASHAGGTQYNFSCSECHAGNTHNSGSTYTDVFKSTVGIIAGTSAIYASPTCSSVYCHSSGRGTYKGGINTVAWGNNKGSIIGQTSECTTCHDTSTYSTSHDKHITANSYGCVTCHAATVSANTVLLGAAKLAGGAHVNGAKDVTFSGIAPAIGTSCATVWCHGGNTPLIPQNSPVRTAPVWGTPFPTTSTLGSGGPAGTSGSGYCAQCHGYPPLTASHTGKTAATCVGCHSHINSDALTFSDKTKHINGTIDASGGHVFPYSGSLHLSAAGTTPWSSCTGCHSNTAGSYPVAAGTAPNCQACHIGGLKAPSGTSSCYDCHGATATNGLPTGTSFPNIAGSHAVHAAVTSACTTCHNGGGNGVVTHGSSNRTAATAASVTVAFTGQGASPAWTLATNTCSATYCHGQGAPTWGATTAAPVNGFPYSATQCEKCHGSAATNPFYSTAIPKVTANTDAHTGAHSDHLSGTKNISSAIACLECHAVPATVTAAGHMDGTTLVAFNGTLAKSNTTTATTCATTWCHGGNTTLIPQNSPARTAPVWGTRFPTTSTLGSGGPAGTSGSGYCAQCHGYPPLTASHTGKTAATCVGCHSHINSDALTFSDKTKHINGTIDASGGHVFPYSGSLHLSAAGTTPWSSCTGCHSNTAGSYPVAAGTAPNCQACHIGGLKAPSGTSSCYDCHGATATNGLPTGTSFPNIAGSHAVHAAVTSACTTCHNGGGNGVVTHGSSNRTAATAASVTVAFTGQGASPAWTLATNTCSATYCHGQGAPTWGATTAAPVNGFPYSATQCEKCHGSAATNPFYSTAIPKVTANTDAHTGAHSDHLSGTKNISSAIACLECHAVPATVTAAGHMDGTTLVAFNGTLAKSNTTTATTCATTWCHGGNTTLIPQNSPARTAPVWGTRFPTTSTLGSGGPAGTSGSGYCAQCHGYPPLTASHTGKIAATCVGCHSHINSDGLTFNDKTKHIDGALQAAGGNCNSCHDYDSVGSVWSGAPTNRYTTTGTWGMNAISAGNTGWGAHAKHINYIKARLNISTPLDPLNQTFGVANPKYVCGTCHTVNAANHNDANRSINFNDGGNMLAPSNAAQQSLLYVTGTNPGYDTIARTCSNLSCHYFTSPAWSN
ncbi:MAG: CxxxxCH/CxxCH domain-containing protein [Desulfuromonadaceae bacterium]|nr:CxxxxCH/CxxCH domain-containing protein [Desulfuromonadaceae bacterium]